LNPDSPDSLQKAHRAAAVIGGAMIAAVFIFAGIAETVARIHAPFTGFSRFGDAQYRILRYVMAGLAALDFLAIPVVRRSILRTQREGGISAARSAPEARLVSAAMVPFAMCLSIAIYGMVLFFMNGNRPDLYYFLMGSLAFFVIFFPTREKWGKWVQGLTAGQGGAAQAGWGPAPVVHEDAAKPSLVACALPILFFAVFLALGLYSTIPLSKRILRNRELVQSGVRTSGKVIDYKTTSGKAGRIWPVVSFVAADGTPVHFESLYHPNYSGYSMGVSVPVLYDLRDPRIAEIDEPERLWGGIVSGYILSGVFILLGGGGMTFILRWGFRKPDRP
jgi:hypothetical protein